MVLPILGALIGAGGSIASGIMGMNAANNAAAYNYYSDLMNFYQRENERKDTINEAKRVEGDQKLGMTDASGNRVRFVDGVGWVTELSDEQDQLRELQEREQIAQLTEDLPMRRRRMQENDVRQDREGAYADRILDAMQRQQSTNPRELELLLNQAATHGITQGFDSALEDGMRASLRTGSNAGKVDAQVGEARANALMQAFLNNRVNARSMAKDESAQQAANMANLYNMFATRASALPEASFQPMNIEGMANSMAQGAASNANSGAGAVVNATGREGGSLSRIDPNYGAANAVGQAGNALAAAFERIGAGSANKNASGAYSNYAFGPAGPVTAYNDMFKKNTGATW